MTFFSDGDSGTPSNSIQATNTWYNSCGTYVVRFVADGCRKNLPLYALTVPEITCPNCDAAFAPADILRNSDCSWPELNWLYFQCPSCDDRCHVEVRDNHMATVRFLGAPGPDWHRIQSCPVPSLLTRADPAFLHCWLDDVHHEFPARS